MPSYKYWNPPISIRLILVICTILISSITHSGTKKYKVFNLPSNHQIASSGFGKEALRVFFGREGFARFIQHDRRFAEQWSTLKGVLGQQMGFSCWRELSAFCSILGNSTSSREICLLVTYRGGVYDDWLSMLLTTIIGMMWQREFLIMSLCFEFCVCFVSIQIAYTCIFNLIKYLGIFLHKTSFF